MRTLAHALALALAVSACGNPAIDTRIDALGDEDPNVPRGEYHRPGQPCLLCHGKYGGVDPEMSVAGTIYATPDDDTPAGGVTVTLTDTQGESLSVKTNCIGNFHVTKEKWDPLFPLHAEIEYAVPGDPDTRKRVVMSSRISRDGSCAGCHAGKVSQTSPGWVYCAAASSGLVFPKPDASCPGAK